MLDVVVLILLELSGGHGARHEVVAHVPVGAEPVAELLETVKELVDGVGQLVDADAHDVVQPRGKLVEHVVHLIGHRVERRHCLLEVVGGLLVRLECVAHLLGNTHKTCQRRGDGDDDRVAQLEHGDGLVEAARCDARLGEAGRHALKGGLVVADVALEPPRPSLETHDLVVETLDLLLELLALPAHPVHPAHRVILAVEVGQLGTEGVEGVLLCPLLLDVVLDLLLNLPHLAAQHLLGVGQLDVFSGVLFARLLELLHGGGVGVVLRLELAERGDEVFHLHVQDDSALFFHCLRCYLD